MDMKYDYKVLHLPTGEIAYSYGKFFNRTTNDLRAILRNCCGGIAACPDHILPNRHICDGCPWYYNCPQPEEVYEITLLPNEEE